MGQQGHRGTRPAPIWAGSTWSTEDVAATTRTGSYLGTKRETHVRNLLSPKAPSPSPPATYPALATHWEPRDAGPPGAEPLGIRGGSRAWALSGERDTERSGPPPQNTSCPGRPPCAHLWLWGSPRGSGLFSPSVVWGCWQAPGAVTEVAGSLVALCGGCGGIGRVIIADTLPTPKPLYAPGKRCLAQGGPSHQRPLGATPGRRSSRLAGTWAPHTACPLLEDFLLLRLGGEPWAPGASRAPTCGHEQSTGPLAATRS